MIFLKTDKEFINEMWEKVSQAEYEEIQRKAAKIRHKKIIITNIIIFLSIIITFTFFIVVKPIIDRTLIYIISIVLLITAYWLDKYISGEKKEKQREAELYEH
jgi:hypothetical protein